MARNRVQKTQLRDSHQSQQQSNIMCGEVVEVITNADHPSYKGDVSLGSMRVKPLGAGHKFSSGPDSGAVWVRPLSRQYMCLPLLGELVVCVKASSLGAQTNPINSTFYWLDTIALYGEKNENSLPNASYHSDKGINDTLGDTFEEVVTPQVHPFEGDTILQGRFDNGIRLGSSQLGQKTKDTWSIGGGASGDPIMILTNQYADDAKIEDINKDKSTVMMTSTQKIDIKLASKEAPETVSVPTGPVLPHKPLNTYMDKPQVIVSSDRLIFNAKNDSVFISAKNNISLSTKAWKLDVTALADILLETLNQLTMEVHPTPAGPSGPPINAVVYGMLKAQLMQMQQ
jgi:hypothetical protein